MCYLSIPKYVRFSFKNAERKILISVFKQQFEICFEESERYHLVIKNFDLENAKFLKGTLDQEFENFLIINKLAYPTPPDYLNDFNGVTGPQLYSMMYHIFNSKWCIERGETELSKILNANSDRNIFFGWLLEYYHVTLLSTSCLTPILAYECDDSFSSHAKHFVLDELFHDKIMIKAFNDLNLDLDRIQSSTPLPSTQAYMDHLKVMADRRPLSFFGSLFVYEGEDDDAIYHLETIPDSIEYKNAKSALSAHVRINVEGGHADFAKEVFENIPIIPKEDWQSAITDLAQLTNLYYLHQSDIHRYYSENDVIGRLR